MTTRSKMTVPVLLIRLGIAIVACAVFAYMWIDSAMSYTYMEASQSSTAAAYDKLSYLLESEWAGLSERAVLEKVEAVARARNNEGIVIDANSTEDVIWFGEVKLEFESGELRGIGK